MLQYRKSHWETHYFHALGIVVKLKLPEKKQWLTRIAKKAELAKGYVSQRIVEVNGRRSALWEIHGLFIKFITVVLRKVNLKVS